jgi:hypothetical protein
MYSDSNFAYIELLTSDLLLERKIALFLDLEERYLSLEEVAMKFDVSIKKIRRVVRLLQEDIFEYNHHGFTFSICKSKGILLKVPIDDDLKHFLAFITQKSPLIKMLEKICLNDFGSVRDYAERYFFSEATIRRRLKKIKRFLNQFDIDLARETVVFEGNEQQIRYFMLLFFWRLYSGISWPFQYIDESEVEQIVNELITLNNKYNNEITRLEKRRMMYYIAIVKIRIRKKNTMSMLPVWEKAKINNDFFQEFSQLFSSFNGSLCTKPAEISLHYEIWKSCSWVPNVKAAFDVEKNNGSEPAKASMLFFDYFKEHFFEMTEAEKESATEFIFCIHTLCFNFKKFKSDINGYYYYRRIQKYYPKLKLRLEHFIDVLYEQSGYSLFLEKNFLVTHYSMLFSHLKRINEYERTIHVTIETELPNMLSELLYDQVYGMFSRKYNIYLDSPNKAEAKEKADVILTTVPLRETKSVSTEKNIVAINRELKKADIRKIEYVFDRILQD